MMTIRLYLCLYCLLYLPFALSLAQRTCVLGMSRRSLLLSALVAPPPANALTPTKASWDYDLYARNYDVLDRSRASEALGIDEARRALFRSATGDVLEIGAGTGLNLDKYVCSQILSLTLVDISEGMLREAQTKATALGINAKFVKADATSDLVRLFGENQFDTVVDSFSLCVMGKGAPQCLVQMAKVVKKPKGRILLLENARSSNPLLGIYQDATADAAAAFGGKGCVYNQDVARMIRETGLLTVDEEQEFSAGLIRSFVCSRTSMTSS